MNGWTRRFATFAVAVFAPMSDSGWKFLLEILQQALAAATGQPAAPAR